jgi:hypothetical protein
MSPVIVNIPLVPGRIALINRQHARFVDAQSAYIDIFDSGAVLWMTGCLCNRGLTRLIHLIGEHWGESPWVTSFKGDHSISSVNCEASIRLPPHATVGFSMHITLMYNFYSYICTSVYYCQNISPKINTKHGLYTTFHPHKNKVGMFDPVAYRNPSIVAWPLRVILPALKGYE